MKFRPLLSIDWSGKLGNQVASTARGGIQYLRALVTPSNPQSFLQTTVRNAIVALTALWTATLTQAERDEWEALATDEESGQNLFLSVNQARQYARSTGRVTEFGSALTPVFEAPPANFTRGTELTLPSTVTVDDSSNSLTITGVNEADPWLADATDTNGGMLFIYISDQQEPSRFARQNPYQLVQVGIVESPAEWNAGGGLSIDLGQFGIATTAGKIVYIKLQAQANNGGLSTPIEIRKTIIA